MNISNNIPEEFDALKDIAPILSKIERKNSFEVPEGYFDALPSKIQGKCIEQEEVSFIPRIYLLLNPKWMVSFSVVIVLVVVGVNYMKDVKPIEIADASQSETISEQDITDIDEALIVEVITDEEPKNENTIDTQDDPIDYLIAHEVDETIIINEL